MKMIFFRYVTLKKYDLLQLIMEGDIVGNIVLQTYNRLTFLELQSSEMVQNNSHTLFIIINFSTIKIYPFTLEKITWEFII